MTESNGRVALREYLERRIDDLFAAHRREHILSDKALEMASVALHSRLEEMNKFRDQLREQAATFIPRELFDEKIDALTKADHTTNVDINRRLVLIELGASNMQGRLWALGVGITIFSTVLVIALNLFIK